jgi:hypothetical protein
MLKAYLHASVNLRHRSVQAGKEKNGTAEAVPRNASDPEDQKLILPKS